MDITVDISQATIKDLDNEVISIGALAVCLQALIDKRDEIQKIVEEGENE